MTHDELLAKMKELSRTFAYEPNLNFESSLRAVVELHKPEHSIRGYRCAFDDELFPCKHHQAIEKELG